MADNIKLPYRYITGLTKQQQHEIWRDFEAVAQQAMGAASVYDAIVDPLLVASVPSRHLYVNFTELFAGEGAHTAGFNIGVVPRSSAQINEPGTISLAGWGHINISAIGPAATESISVANAPFWNMPAVNMASGQIISMSGIHVPSGSAATGFFGFAGANIVLLNECWIGSGINLSPGSLYATDSFLGTGHLTSGSTSDLVILHDCTWLGAVGLGGISTFHMLGGYLNGSLTTTGNIPSFMLECAIAGTVQLNHVEGGVVNNLGSQNGTFFSVGAAITGAVMVTGAWSQVWLQGRGIRADVRLNLIGANPGLQLVGVTDSLITADFVPVSTGAQAYTIDAASARNLIVAGGTHNAFFTVASTNAGATCLVIDELFTGGGGGMIPLTNTHVYVGNGSNVATDVPMSGDIAITNTGATAIQNAAVTLAKMANETALTLLGNATGGSATPQYLSVATVKTLLAYTEADIPSLVADLAAARRNYLTRTLVRQVFG